MTYEQFLETVQEVMEDKARFTPRQIAWIDRYTELEIAGEDRDKAKKQAFKDLMGATYEE